MKIELVISTDALGDFNTVEDNQRYVSAVQYKLQSEYPEADVFVELVDSLNTSSCWVSNDDTGNIKENVNFISNKVWNMADY